MRGWCRRRWRGPLVREKQKKVEVELYAKVDENERAEEKKLR